MTPGWIDLQHTLDGLNGTRRTHAVNVFATASPVHCLPLPVPATFQYYIIVLRGSIELELDGGRRVPLEPGGIIIQNGTNHAWHNVGQERGMLAAVMLGARQ